MAQAANEKLQASLQGQAAGTELVRASTRWMVRPDNWMVFNGF